MSGFGVVRDAEGGCHPGYEVGADVVVKGAWRRATTRNLGAS